MTSCRSGKGREDFSQVREDLPQVLEDIPLIREWSAGTPAGPGRVGMTSRRSRKGQEDLPQVREGLGGPQAGPGGVGTTSRRSRRTFHKFGRGRDVLPQV